MRTEKLSKLEVSVAALCGVILFIATMTGPRLSQGVARDRLVAVNVRQSREIAALENALDAARDQGRVLQKQLAQAGHQLEEVRVNLSALQQERETLSTQLAAATRRVSELETKLQVTDQEMSKLKGLPSVQKANKERDEAVARAEKAEDRVRELTLRLHRSGIWP